MAFTSFAGRFGRNRAAPQSLRGTVLETLELRQLLSSDLGASESLEPHSVQRAPVADHTIAPMTPGRRVAFTGELGVLNPDDTYHFRIDKPLVITAKLLDLRADLDLRLFNGNGDLLQESAKSGTIIEFISRALKSGAYFLQMAPGESNIVGGRYHLSLGAAGVASPTRVSATPLGGNSMRVEWLDSSDNETSFRIEHFVNGTWKRIGWALPDATAVVVDGLTPATAYHFRVVARSETSAAPAMNSAQAVTGNTDTSGWYKIDSLTFDGAAEAVWSIDSQDLAIQPQFAGRWITAGSWEAAVNQAVAGTVTIDRGNGTLTTHAFPTAGDFRMGLAGVMRDNGDGVADEGEIAGNELPNDPARKVIVVEDSYGDIDRDYDDFTWTVQTTYSSQLPDYGILYFNNLQAPLAGEWTPARTADVGNGEIVLGKFTGGESAVLSIANLPPLGALSLSYDLYLIDEDGGAMLQSDGSSANLSSAALDGLRPNGIAVDVVGGRSLMPLRGSDGTALDVAAVVSAGSLWPAGPDQPIRTNFGFGALPGVPHASPSSALVAAPMAALSTQSSLVGASYSVYQLRHTFAHTDDTLLINFSSLPEQPSSGGGTWAIDNIALTHL